MEENQFGGFDPSPPVNSATDVWPPPPLSQPQGLWFPFKTILSRAEGSVPNFRLGSLSLSESGAFIQGKAVTRYEIQVPILIACLFLRLGFFIAYAILEYGFRRDETLAVPWANVRKIVIVPEKRRVCLVYDAPNYKGIVKTFSLTFSLPAGQYETFVSSAQQYLPDRIGPGRLRAWTSPPTWVFLGALLLSLAIILVFSTVNGLRS